MSRGRKAETTKLGTSTTSRDLEVDGHAADGVGLLAGPAAVVLQVVDHVEQGVAGGQGEVLGAVLAVAGDRQAGGGEEPAGGGELGRQVVVVAGELEVLDAAGGGPALVDGEADGQGRAHLDGGATGLVVALGEVGVAGREQPALGVHRDVEPGALAELLDVDVAGGLPGRDGAQGLGGDGRIRGDGVGRVGREHEPAPVDGGLLAGGGPLHQGPVGRQPDGAHERRPGDAQPRQVLGGGPAALDAPAGHVRVGEHVAQEPEAGHLHGVAVAVRLDLQDLDLEQVARLGPVDVHRPGEGVDHVQVGRGHGLQGRLRPHLPVEGVAGAQHHLVAGVADDHRRDVRVPAVVAGLRLLGQGLRVVDPHLVRCHGHPPGHRLGAADHRRSRPAGRGSSPLRRAGRKLR